jgi:hypothetical protein
MVSLGVVVGIRSFVAAENDGAGGVECGRGARRHKDGDLGLLDDE